MYNNVQLENFLILKRNGLEYRRTFLDIRIVHPTSPTYENKSMQQIYSQNEKEKKRSYNERIIQVEKSSFTPMVYSTLGGIGPEAEKHHKRISKLIAEKKNEEYSDISNYIRTRIRFCILKSTLIAIRGVRGKQNESSNPLPSLSFNLIDFND